MKNGFTLPKLVLLLVQVITFAVIAVTATGQYGMADGIRITVAYLGAYLVPCVVLSKARGSSMAAHVVLLLLAMLLFYINFSRLALWTAPHGYSLQYPYVRGDSRHYYKWALYKYLGRSEDVVMIYPGFPMLMLGLWKVLGLNVVWPQAMNTMFVMLSVVLTGMTTRRLLSHRVAVSSRGLLGGAMVLMCLFTYYIVINTTILKEGSVCMSMTMAGFALSSMAACDEERRRHWRDILLLVLAGVLLALVRTTYLYFIMIGIILMAVPHWRRDWIMALSMLLVMVLLLGLGDYFSAYSFDRHAEIAGGGWNMQQTYIIGDTQRFYRNFLDYYFLYSVWHKAILLPVTMAVQFLIPFPWNSEMVDSFINNLARWTYGWYMVSGTSLFYYLFLSWRKDMNMGAWPWWPAVLFAALAYLMAGSVARYVVPVLPLFVPVAMYVLCLLYDRRWRRSFAWWMCIFVILLVAALVLCLELQHSTVSQMLGMPPMGDRFIELFK